MHILEPLRSIHLLEALNNVVAVHLAIVHIFPAAFNCKHSLILYFASSLNATSTWESFFFPVLQFKWEEIVIRVTKVSRSPINMYVHFLS